MNSNVLVQEFENYMASLGKPLMKAFRKFGKKESTRGVIEYDKQAERWVIRVEETDGETAGTVTDTLGTTTEKPMTAMMNNWAESGIVTIDGVAGKVCCCCGEWKPLNDYYNWSRSKDGKGSRCKACTKVYQTERYKTECMKRFNKN